MSVGLGRGNICIFALQNLQTSWQDTFLIKHIRKNILPRLATALQAFQYEHTQFSGKSLAIDKEPYTHNHSSF